MTIKSKTNPRGAGRKPSGLPKRVRRNLNIERDERLDISIAVIRKVLASRNDCPIKDITQTHAIRYAIAFTLANIPIEEALK